MSSNSRAGFNEGWVIGGVVVLSRAFFIKARGDIITNNEGGSSMDTELYKELTLWTENQL